MLPVTIKEISVSAISTTERLLEIYDPEIAGGHFEQVVTVPLKEPKINVTVRLWVNSLDKLSINDSYIDNNGIVYLAINESELMLINYRGSSFYNHPKGVELLISKFKEGENHG
jgi:hypothetical protein